MLFFYWCNTALCDTSTMEFSLHKKIFVCKIMCHLRAVEHFCKIPIWRPPPVKSNGPLIMWPTCGHPGSFMRGVLSRVHIPTQAFGSVINRTCGSNLLTTRFSYIIACVWSRYVSILMLPLNRPLSLIIKLKLRL